MNNILFTGAHGLLGNYMLPLLEELVDGKIITPTHQEYDLSHPILPVYKDLAFIIHAGAYTSVIGAETEAAICFETNVGGTLRLRHAYKDTPFIYISTEYAAHPELNIYSWTKELGEEIVMRIATAPYLIIRTLFKPVPFPFEKAYGDQWTQGDEITTIAPLLVGKITQWYKNDFPNEFCYIGTGRKRIIDIARKSNHAIEENSIHDIEGVTLQSDYE